MATNKFGPDDQNPPSLQDVQAQIEAMESQYMRFEPDGSEGDGDGEETVSLAASARSEPTVQLPANDGTVPKQDPGTKSLVLSTFLSLVAVLILLRGRSSRFTADAGMVSLRLGEGTASGRI